MRSEASAAGVELTSPHALNREWFNDGLEVAPWHDDQGLTPNVSSADELLAVGVRQLEIARTKFGALATVGGPLVMVEVS